MKGGHGKASLSGRRGGPSMVWSIASRARVVSLVTLVLLGLGIVGGERAQAHNKTSLIDVAVASASGGVRVQADVRYDDGDPVLDEDVVGLLRDGASGETTQLKFGSSGSAGQYITDIPLRAGAWDLEVDAVTYTRGVRTVHFTMSEAGDVSRVVSVAALPDTLERPATARSRIGMIVVWAVVVAFGLLIVFVVVELRRRSRASNV